MPPTTSRPHSFGLPGFNPATTLAAPGDVVPTNPPQTDSNFIANVSEASSYGAELELVALLWENWQVNFAGSYVKPEFGDDALDFGLGAQCALSNNPVCPSVTVTRPGLPDANASPIDDNQLARTPQWQLAAGVEYFNQFAGGWEYRLRGDVSYQDEQYGDNLNLSELPDRTIVDLNFTLTTPDQDFSVTLWGKNVTDEDYVSNSFIVAFVNSYGASLAPGASWGLTGRYAFGGSR